MKYKSQKNVAGVDEVGRGSLIGPVYAAAVIFKKGFDKKKVKDSKKLSVKKREFLENYIKKNSYWAIGSASQTEIEKLNILNASLLAMKRAIQKLKKKPTLVLIDGNKLPVAITDACLAFLVFSIAFSRFIFSSINSVKKEFRLSSLKFFHHS